MQNLALGHHKLSIIDLSTAATQTFNYKPLHLTYDGEVYNFFEIKLELEQKGHQFKNDGILKRCHYKIFEGFKICQISIQYSKQL